MPSPLRSDVQAHIRPKLILIALALSAACASPPPPVCGDKVINGDDECDDGNVKDGDGCSSTCLSESGWYCDEEYFYVDEQTEEYGTGHCTPNCGDRLVVGDEVCDVGSSSPEKGRDNCLDCKVVAGACGDGEINEEAGEVCDDESAGCVNCAQRWGWLCGPEGAPCHQSELEGTLALNDLTTEQMTTFCTWEIGLLGGEENVSYCSHGGTDYQVTASTVADCSAAFADVDFGTCTIAEVEDWVSGGDTCTLLMENPPCL